MAETPMFTGLQSVGRATALVGALRALGALRDPARSSEASRLGPQAVRFLATYFPAVGIKLHVAPN